MEKGNMVRTAIDDIDGRSPGLARGRRQEGELWQFIREWFRVQKGIQGSSTISLSASSLGCNNIPAKSQDLRLLLGVLGCPLAPITIANDPIDHLLHLKDISFLRDFHCISYHTTIFGSDGVLEAAGMKMICCETEVSSGRNLKTVGAQNGESGCFVVWQMMLGMWSLELVVGSNKVVAGSGKIVWRHTPWLGAHAAKGPQRPLHRSIHVNL